MSRSLVKTTNFRKVWRFVEILVEIKNELGCHESKLILKGQVPYENRPFF
jgi:hypothetical protein